MFPTVLPQILSSQLHTTITQQSLYQIQQSLPYTSFPVHSFDAHTVLSLADTLYGRNSDTFRRVPAFQPVSPLSQPCVQLHSRLYILCIQLPEFPKCHIQIVFLPNLIVPFIIKGFPLRCKAPFLYLFIFPGPVLTLEFDEPGTCLIIFISWHIHHLLFITHAKTGA